MKQFVQSLALIGSCILLSACNFFSQPVDLQTEGLQNEQAGTQIALVRASATVNADRMEVTLNSVQTAVGEVNLQSTRIAATLIAQGTPFIDGNLITPVVPTEAVQQQSAGSPIPQIANPLLTPGSQANTVPQVSGQGSAQGDSPLLPGTPTTPDQPPADTGSAALSSIQLAAQVGGDDCPINPTTSFTDADTDIYVTANANIAANATLTASFALNGQEVKTYTWSPGFAVNGACIWFHMPSSEVAFTPGSWTVQLTVDGAAVGAPIAFTIVTSTPSQINLTPESGG